VHDTESLAEASSHLMRRVEVENKLLDSMNTFNYGDKRSAKQVETLIILVVERIVVVHFSSTSSFDQVLPAQCFSRATNARAHVQSD
jgi:hypothetical protein